MTYEEIAAEIRLLTIEQRKKLVVLIVDSLTEQPSQHERSLLELEGLGAALWQGVDGQDYVDGLRHEWNQRP